MQRKATIRQQQRGTLLAQVVVDLFRSVVPLRACGGRRKPVLDKSAEWAVSVDMVRTRAVKAQLAVIRGSPLLRLPRQALWRGIPAAWLGLSRKLP